MRTLSFLFVLSFLFSCKHENDTTDNTVIIGDSHRNYTIIKLNPEILINEFHEDSLDLNSDGIFEIKFIVSPIRTSTAEPGSKTEIYTKNNLQILLSRLNYENPDTLSAKTVLNKDIYWSDSTSYGTFTLLSYACYTYTHCLGSGNFKNVYEKYIGFKLDNKFGWIKVDSFTAALTIKEYTVLD